MATMQCWQGFEMQKGMCCCRDKETGMMKGDALVTFLQRPSVSLACTLMHGRAFRPLRGGRPMVVQEAQFEPKGDSAAASGAAAPAASKGAQSNSAAKGSRGGGSSKGKGKKAPSQAARALGWGGFDDKHKATEVRTVIQSTRNCACSLHQVMNGQ
jgi:HIV Tat-specific factor 1